MFTTTTTRLGHHESSILAARFKVKHNSNLNITDVINKKIKNIYQKIKNRNYHDNISREYHKRKTAEKELLWKSGDHIRVAVLSLYSAARQYDNKRCCGHSTISWFNIKYELDKKINGLKIKSERDNKISSWIGEYIRDMINIYSMYGFWFFDAPNRAPVIKSTFQNNGSTRPIIACIASTNTWAYIAEDYAMMDDVMCINAKNLLINDDDDGDDDDDDEHHSDSSNDEEDNIIFDLNKLNDDYEEVVVLVDCTNTDHNKLMDKLKVEWTGPTHYLDEYWNNLFAIRYGYHYKTNNYKKNQKTYNIDDLLNVDKFVEWVVKTSTPIAGGCKHFFKNQNYMDQLNTWINVGRSRSN